MGAREKNVPCVLGVCKGVCGGERKEEGSSRSFRAGMMGL